MKEKMQWKMKGKENERKKGREKEKKTGPILQASSSFACHNSPLCMYIPLAHCGSHRLPRIFYYFITSTNHTTGPPRRYNAGKWLEFGNNLQKQKTTSD